MLSRWVLICLLGAADHSLLGRRQSRCKLKIIQQDKTWLQAGAGFTPGYYYERLNQYTFVRKRGLFKTV